MNKAQLVKAICKAEGLKSQVSVGNAREILKVLRNLIAEDSSALEALLTMPKKKR